MVMLRGGLSGCGRIGEQVLRATALHQHCRIEALHDPDPAARARLGASFDLRVQCASFRELLLTGVDFVVLAGPCGVRLQQVEAAAAAGVHCLLHCPMAPDAVTARAMVAACDAAQVKLGVVVAGQADPLFEQLRQMIAADWLGGTVLVQACQAEDDVLWQPPRPGDWRLDPELAGRGALLRLATEQLHLASWLTGRGILSAVACRSRGFTALDEDSATASLTLRGGGLLTLAASHLTRDRSIAVLGTDGGFRLGGGALWLRGRTAFRGPVFDYRPPGAEVLLQGAELQPAEAAAAPATELHGRFARWIDDEDEFPCPGDQAARDLAAVDAAARAIVSGRAETVVVTGS